MPTLSAEQEIKAVLKELPDLTARELFCLIPDISEAAISTALYSMKNRGMFTINRKAVPVKNGHRTFPSYTLNPDPKPPSKPMKLKAPTEVGLQARLDEANAKIAELEEWKTSAIARFPDLAVDPAIIKARKIVAAELKAAGDCGLAEQVLRGLKDETMLVKVTARALEEADA